jgi:hypothetical protein
MWIFPELSSGAAAQFPWRRTIGFRTVRNRFAAGQEIDYGDILFAQRRWELPLTDLEDAEWQAIHNLFEETGGRRLPFTFVEPGANLLAWSGDLDKGVWVKSSGVTVDAGQPDPGGGSAASTLSAGGTWTVSQTIAAPASRAFAVSAWLKCNASGSTLGLSDGAGQTKQVQIAGDNAWRLYELPWRQASAADQVIFEISGSGGATIDAYGLQVEPQLGRSSYKRTGEQSGIFVNAFFDQDSLEQSITAPNQNSGIVRIQWTPSPI